ncbi:MAG: hypothetical protein MUQ10_18475 [Anaerolineae bacterium]|nr:hypothetical protein [Anaerolineae bacterium]
MNDGIALDVAIEFVAKIDLRDFQGLHSLMTRDFLSIPAEGSETMGSVDAATGIEQNTKHLPDFQIHIAESTWVVIPYP